MKITILNGNMGQEESAFTRYLDRLCTELVGQHQVERFDLSKMELHYCTGCWSCWWKTPGLCALHDDANPIFRSVINADFLIFASPLMAGFTSSALKKITDRLIILLHPYVELQQGECHHVKRYDRYPEFGLLVGRESDTDDEDLEIIAGIYDRFALNFHNHKRFIHLTDRSTPEETAHEISSVQRFAAV